MKVLRAAAALVLAAAIFWGLHFRHGLFPPLGKLFNPFTGFWQNGGQGDRLPGLLELPGLRDAVQVVWDARHVAHIFARNDHDLYLAQGYLAARDRLWQMEFQALYSAGRLSEVVGPVLLQHDRLQRRLGMVWAAEKTVQSMENDPLTNRAVDAYTKGVNAYIKSLSSRERPVEYKILDYSPEPWSALKSALLMKYLAWMLSGDSQDEIMTATREAHGEGFIRSLYPDFPPFLEPIIPQSTVWDFQPAPLPEPLSVPAASTGQGQGGAGTVDRKEGLGSNNWAVSGKLTRSGFPILCNDPHLGLTLPSIWYEVQLSAPGVSVYGVSLLGAPGVVLGFNRHAAWGMTNGGSDVLDWYRIKFRAGSLKEYLYNGKWRPVIHRLEKVKVRGGRTVEDRVVYTHHGPVVCLANEEPLGWGIPPGAALRWAGHDVSSEFLTLYKLNRVDGYEGFLEALKDWSCPAQNFVYADNRGDIALWHNGRLPLRWKGQGRFLLDGADPADEWHGRVPWEHNPHVKNPERGFVSSANQPPTDETYPYYLGWDYVSFERGWRINELLSLMKDATAEDMVRMQNDNLNLKARFLLPCLIPLLSQAELAAGEKAFLEALEKWNYENRADSAAPLVFETLWRVLNALTWNDEKKSGMDILWPCSNVFVDMMLNRPCSPFFDDKTTPAVESFPDIVVAAFKKACRQLEDKHGPFGNSWQWGRARGTDILHLGRLPGFGRERLATGGGGGIINAMQRTWGPSWKMIIELGPEVKAWGIVPGGQSGNPGSRFYDNAVDDWAAGKVYELLFLRSADQPMPGLSARTELRGVQ